MKVDPKSRKLFRQVLKWHNDKFDKLTGIKEVNGKLKLFTPEAKEIIKLKPVINHKQKKVINSIKKAILHLNLLSLLIVFSCGTDDIMNTGNPPVGNESLVYSLDSVSLLGTGLQNTSKEDTVMTNMDNDSLKVTFTVSTNCLNTDNVSLRTFIGSYGGNEYSLITNNIDDMNRTYTGYFRKNKNTVIANITMTFNSSVSKYLKVSNIKVYKL